VSIELPKNPPIPTEQPLDILKTGRLELSGEFVWGSNYTFLVNAEKDGITLAGVYKPTRGERPLWDFPRASLAHREAAAFLVSQFLGWDLVPATVYRRKAPYGPGSLQLFIQHDPEYHYFNFSPQDRQRLRPVVLFDYLINNADRKGSHVLVDPQDHLWLIDHGISFHEEDKLRTVIWDFCGESLPEEYRAPVKRLAVALQTGEKQVEELNQHLTAIEIQMLGHRAEWLSRLETFPNPPEHRRATPWPPI
jgi:uncharacterized repeat protein (TIGR03843 family)